MQTVGVEGRVPCRYRRNGRELRAFELSACADGFAELFVVVRDIAVELFLRDAENVVVSASALKADDNELRRDSFAVRLVSHRGDLLGSGDRVLDVLFIVVALEIVVVDRRKEVHRTFSAGISLCVEAFLEVRHELVAHDRGPRIIVEVTAPYGKRRKVLGLRPLLEDAELAAAAVADDYLSGGVAGLRVKRIDIDRRR